MCRTPNLTDKSFVITFDHARHARDAERAQREQKSALEIAFGQRATDAAQNEKRTDERKTHGVAEIALPINEGIFGQFAPQRGSEKFIHDGQNVHHIEHEVIEHHQNDAKA